jgi:hypothetical protein
MAVMGSHRVERIPLRIAYRTEEEAEIFILISELEFG